MEEQWHELLLEAAVNPTLAQRVLEDARVLLRLLPADQIERHYIAPIVAGEIGATAELFVAARTSRSADRFGLHPTTRGGRRCDVILEFGADTIYIEVKHQRDRFPFNSPGEEIGPGVQFFSGSRPGADPRYLQQRADTSQQLPGAAIWRDTLEEAAVQLSVGSANLIAVSCDAMGGLDDDTCAALFGDPVTVATPHPRGWGSVIEERRLRNGVFHDERFEHVAGVWFFRLRVGSGSQGVLRCDWARGATNPRYVGPPLPDVLTLAIPNVVGRED